MESILETLSQSIGIWGYAVLFFYSFGGGLVALIAASILSSGVIESINSLNIYVCIFIASIANFIGSSLLFYMARYQKKEVMKYFSAHRRKIALSHIWIKKYSYLIIFIHKYLYGIKTIIPLVIGFSKFDSKKFLIYNFFASFVWGILIGGFSYAMGDIIRNLYDKYSNPYIFPIVGIIIIVLFFILANKITKKV
ncbi:DedA family protein [Helicobacter sp. MIT 99-5507]|uniref:DedA family protein n=1 Tax=Helicobacter sp. MIT 99-5507 TaxID=152489 RepID=UPI002163A81F|nr:DedA family protein [Helicobacter sp. MIT 99-5507]